MKYYNSQYQKYEKNESIDFFIIFLNVFKCRHCQCIFSFNNRFYDHVRSKACLQQFAFVVSTKFFKSFNLKQFFFIEDRKTITNVFVVESFNIEITKKFESFIKLFIVYFFVDFKSNIDIDYKYRNWNYVKITIVFFENVNSKMCCLNINVDVILNICKISSRIWSESNQIKQIKFRFYFDSVKLMITCNNHVQDYLIVCIKKLKLC